MGTRKTFTYKLVLLGDAGVGKVWQKMQNTFQLFFV